MNEDNMKNVNSTIRIVVAAGATCALAAQASEPQTQIQTVNVVAARSLLKVSDSLRQPPAPKGEAPVAPEASRRDLAIMELRRRFNAAADPVTHRMSLAQARQTGWSSVAEHFSEIDRSGQGAVSFDEVALYLRNRWHPAFTN
ncbi:hypothetical protein WS72_18420 [Burkholderia savannae]|uniref:EF-hand domain-containing protein n=1 Tax=Burkholderia savannae TaxID=1637837 RepID=A0ABR5T8I0_9BURK|nr:hypothetical protein WS72_18420 [Burkholderia savannae]